MFMTFSKLPETLKERFRPYQKTGRRALDINGYPLDRLSDDEFTAFIAVLKDLPWLVTLNLANCNLNKLKPEQHDALWQAIKTRRQLAFLTIQGTGEQKLSPEFLLELTTLPALRVFKQNPKSSGYEFLNYSDAKALINLLEQEPVFAADYLQTATADIESEAYDVLKKEHEIISALHTHRLAIKSASPSPYWFPPQTMEALRILDCLQHTGAQMSYEHAQTKFTLNLEACDVASCTRVALLLLNRLPNDFNIQLTLPDGALGHFAQAALTKLQEKYPQTLTVTNYSPTQYSIEQTTPAYAQLSSLSHSFSLCDSSFYALLNNKEQLHESIVLLKQILQDNNTEMHHLVYEFFMVHQLYSFPVEINELDTLNKAVGEKNQPKAITQLRENILALLNSEHHAVSTQLRESTTMVDAPKIPGEPSKVTPDAVKAKARMALQAKAWLGKIAFEEINQNSGEGIYWYGRFLHEFPLRAQENRTEKALPSAIDTVSVKQFAPKETGIYWLRLAATHHKNRSAHTYLSALFSRQPSLAPMERYQLTLATEELEVPQKKGELFKPHHNFLELFPRHDFWVRFNETMSFGASENTPYAKEHLFYLKLLLQDNLITEKAKLTLVKQIIDSPNVYTWMFSSQLKHHKKELTLTHASPLGAQIQSELLPILNKYKKGNKNSALDNTKPMSEQPVARRLGVFCTFFVEHLEHYLKKRTLFGTEIAEDAAPSYVAVLIHELLTQSINRFELHNTPLDNELNEAMHSMKQGLHEDAFRRALATQPASFGFAQVMTNRFKSYSTTAYVANVSNLSLLRKFGEKQPHKEKEHGLSLKKIIAGGALAIESLHVALPLVIAVTGVTLPVVGVWAVIAGLQVALDKIHHYAHLVEKGAEAGKLATDLVVGLAHGHHLAHEAGLIAHKHHEGPPPLIELDTIKHFNRLLQSASVNDIDSITTLINQWRAIYQPATDELTDTSNNLLGILLVELLMRGLTLRLYAEQQSLAKKTEHPKSLPALLDYLNETLWLYSCPRISDDAHLMTKNMKVFSALDLIFPTRLQARHLAKLIEIAVEPANRPQERIASTAQVGLTRFASNYEVQQINQLCGIIPPNPAFTLVNGGHQVLINNKSVEVRIAYDERNTLREDISFLYEKDDLQDLQFEVIRCKELIQSVYEKVTAHHVKDKEKFNLLMSNLDIVGDILSNSVAQLKRPNLPINNTFKDMSKFVFNNPKLSPKIAVNDFLDQVASFLIVYNRKHQLGIERLENHIYAGLEQSHLEDMTKLLDKSPEPKKPIPNPGSEPKSTPIKVSETKVGLFTGKSASVSPPLPTTTSSLTL